METDLLLSFLGAAVLLTIMPGPDNILVLTESLTKGQKSGIALSVGLSSGVLVHTIAAATGLSLIIQQSALAFSLVKYAGAAYLFFLAFRAIREKNPEINLTNPLSDKETRIFPLVRKGFLMNVLNPKVSLFFIAFLPQFVNHNGPDITFQMIVLGGLFMIQALLIFSLIAVLAGKLTGLFRHPKFWPVTKWTKVGVLALLGITLAFSKK